MASQDADKKSIETPTKKALKPIDSNRRSTIDATPKLEEEPTNEVTPFGRPNEAPEPGKKWVKIKKTEQTMDAKGYMCFKDVEVWEQVDDVKQARKAIGSQA